MSVVLVYETHSITTDNELGIATGWNEGELSAAGIEAAYDLGRRRRNDGISAVYTSDLRRAVQTADIAFGASGLPVIKDARLRECNYGEWNGLPRSRWEDPTEFIKSPFPGGESYEQVVERTREFLAELVSKRNGQRVLVIAHSANRWALDHLVKGEPLADAINRDFSWLPGWEYIVD